MSLGPGQLERFAKAILEHPFRWGVFRPSIKSQDALTCLRLFAEHYAGCTKGSCRAYSDAFLIAYFSHLTEEGLRELVSALRQMELGDFFYVARRTIHQAAKGGCKPEAVYIPLLKDHDLCVRELSSNLQAINETIQPGRILATRTWGTRVRELRVPGISTRKERDYLPLTVVTNALTWSEPSL